MRSFDGEMDMMDKQLMRMFQFPKIKMDHKWLKGSDKFWKGFPKKNEQARGSSFVSGSSFSSETRNGKTKTSSSKFAEQKRATKNRGSKAKCIARSKSSDSKNGKVLHKEGNDKWVDCDKLKRNEED